MVPFVPPVVDVLAVGILLLALLLFLLVDVVDVLLVLRRERGPELASGLRARHRIQRVRRSLVSLQAAAICRREAAGHALERPIRCGQIN